MPRGEDEEEEQEDERGREDSDEYWASAKEEEGMLWAILLTGVCILLLLAEALPRASRAVNPSLSAIRSPNSTRSDLR